MFMSATAETCGEVAQPYPTFFIDILTPLRLREVVRDSSFDSSFIYDGFIPSYTIYQKSCYAYNLIITGMIHADSQFLALDNYP